MTCTILEDAEARQRLVKMSNYSGLQASAVILQVLSIIGQSQEKTIEGEI